MELPPTVVDTSLVIENGHDAGDMMQVRTLFVSGLPMDAKPRELYLLFRAYKGYESSLLKIMGKHAGKPPGQFGPPLPGPQGIQGMPGQGGMPGQQGFSIHQMPKNPVGFVTFNSRCAAEAAKQDLQGVRFDPDLPQTLRLEFAKSNTKVTKPKQQSPQPAATHPTLVHPITGQEIGAAFFPGMAGMSEAWAAHPLAAYTDLGPAAALHHPTLIQHPALAQVPVHPSMAIAHHHPAATMTSMTPPSSMASAVPHPHLAMPSPMLASPVSCTTPRDPVSTATIAAAAAQTQLPVGLNQPCSTLFIANLGPFCSEQELKDLFSSFPGFSRLKMHNKGGSPVAFVQFSEVHFANEAKNRLQGFVLLSSERGGIRIEFAKNKMGEVRKDEVLPPLSSPHSPVMITTNGSQ